MKPIVDINYSSFIHKLSMVHIFIWFHQDCKSLQQGIGEMELFLQYWTIIHEIYWPLNLKYFWNLKKYNLHHNIKYWSKIISLKEMNSSPSVSHSIELKYGKKTWDERKKKLNLIFTKASVNWTCNLWIHLNSFKYLSGLSKHQLGWESFTHEIG